MNKKQNKSNSVAVKKYTISKSKPLRIQFHDGWKVVVSFDIDTNLELVTAKQICNNLHMDMLSYLRNSFHSVWIFRKKEGVNGYHASAVFTPESHTLQLSLWIRTIWDKVSKSEVSISKKSNEAASGVQMLGGEYVDEIIREVGYIFKSHIISNNNVKEFQS